MDKFKFKFEGTLHNAFYVADDFKDKIYYSVTITDRQLQKKFLKEFVITYYKDGRKHPYEWVPNASMNAQEFMHSVGEGLKNHLETIARKR